MIVAPKRTTTSLPIRRSRTTEEAPVTEREFWLEIYRNVGHIVKGVAGISATIAKRYALGEREAAGPPARR